MSDEAKVEALRSVRCFARIDGFDLVSMAALAEERAVAPGTVVARGAFTGECLLVLSGRAMVTVCGFDVREVGPGAVLGTHLAPGCQVDSATVTALTLVHLLVIPVPVPD